DRLTVLPAPPILRGCASCLFPLRVPACGGAAKRESAVPGCDPRLAAKLPSRVLPRLPAHASRFPGNAVQALFLWRHRPVGRRLPVRLAWLPESLRVYETLAQAHACAFRGSLRPGEVLRSPLRRLFVPALDAQASSPLVA